MDLAEQDDMQSIKQLAVSERFCCFFHIALRCGGVIWAIFAILITAMSPGHDLLSRKTQTLPGIEIEANCHFWICCATSKLALCRNVSVANQSNLIGVLMTLKSLA